MSGAMENRAAVFTSSSQDVEVCSAGGWWPGSLLGWRHEPDGSCQVWIRAVVAGVERTAWAELVDVRLPERPALHALPAVAASPARDCGSDASAGTVGLFAVRDAAPQGAADPALLVGVRRPGGRRRAPEERDAAAQGAATREMQAATGVPATTGRHRAPAPAEGAVPGRHRAADTGVFAAVAADGGRRAPVPPRPRRSDDAWAPTTGASGPALPVVPEQGGAADDGEFFTRPLRLATAIPQQRGPRREG